MPKMDITNLRFSSSAVDDFMSDSPSVKVASAGRIRVANVNQLEGFQVISADKLVHLSQQDFWRLGQDEEGFFIERLVDDTDGPVKG